MDNDILRTERAKRGSPYLNTAHAALYLGVSELVGFPPGRLVQSPW